MENNLEELNKTWQEGALRNFIKRMYIYYDPMDLIVLGAPYDEYDSYIGELLSYLLSNKIKNKPILSQLIYSNFSEDDNNIALRKKTDRMAEDIIELLTAK